MNLLLCCLNRQYACNVHLLKDRQRSSAPGSVKLAKLSYQLSYFKFQYTKEKLDFSLYGDINHVQVKFILKREEIKFPFFHYYFFNMDISLDT